MAVADPDSAPAADPPRPAASPAGRGGPNGFRAEGGVRFEGSGGAVELFVGAERRIDPYPLEFGTATWMTAGFRLLSR